MKNAVKYTLFTFLAVVVILQFIPVTIPENTDDLSNDLIQTQNVPTEVADILRQSCYDCHSSNTVYPWYSHVAPVSWLVVRDVNKGREELNFSEWNSLSKRKQLKSLNNIAEEVESKEMPMKIYTVVHRDAALDENDISLITSWANTTSEQMLNSDEDPSPEVETDEEVVEEIEDDTIQ
ncbi:MAG: heme-binding domain-containing protein [Cyclobacteriaceae bacterium]|nr:heme-binding domain-containing protein [Cyclobacteriaceae bacterium]